MSEIVPEFGGCLWPVDPACLSDEWQAMDLDIQERALGYASATLERLTGRRVGNCPIKVRPVPQRASCFVPGEYSAWLSPGMDTSGNWVNNCSYLSGYPGGPSTVELPFPIGRVDEVKINGSALAPADYWVQSNRWLRLAATIPVPLLQDLSKPDTEPGTFSVTYLNAWPVDALGANAAAVLAMEFAKACTGKGKCALPTGVTQIVRQGISMNIVSGAFPNGETGIRVVDTYIALWNPKHLTQGATVWTPDQAQVVW
jgi:hypothetical protein